jgi:hypothetical protein
MLFDSTKINLGKLNVRSAEQASSISIGNTLKVTRYVTAKKIRPSDSSTLINVFQQDLLKK